MDLLEKDISRCYVTAKVRSKFQVKLYTAVVRPIMKMLRRMCRVTKVDKVRNNEVSSDIEEHARKKTTRLQWFGRVRRRVESFWGNRRCDGGTGLGKEVHVLMVVDGLCKGRPGGKAATGRRCA